jgi:hypothetical protein
MFEKNVLVDTDASIYKRGALRRSSTRERRNGFMMS